MSLGKADAMATRWIVAPRAQEAAKTLELLMALGLLMCCGMISGAGIKTLANARHATSVTPASETNSSRNQAGTGIGVAGGCVRLIIGSTNPVSDFGRIEGLMYSGTCIQGSQRVKI